MSLQQLTVRRAKTHFGRGKNYDSESQTYAVERIISAVPSICKKDGVSDGLVNAKVTIDTGQGANVLYLWVTETAAAVEALDD
jgi:hypothetical protein